MIAPAGDPGWLLALRFPRFDALVIAISFRSRRHPTLPMLVFQRAHGRKLRKSTLTLILGVVGIVGFIARNHGFAAAIRWLNRLASPYLLWAALPRVAASFLSGEIWSIRFIKQRTLIITPV
ncbi:hypothetical protein KCP73_02855 [Salmonella enterica subsp. enterica]|nr:hypothetical protein KCP73_02855 [Salmonella enterica subsp. enterica]